MDMFNWLGTGGRDVTMRCEAGHLWSTRLVVTGPGFSEVQQSRCDCGLEGEVWC